MSLPWVRVDRSEKSKPFGAWSDGYFARQCAISRKVSKMFGNNRMVLEKLIDMLLDGRRARSAAVALFPIMFV